MLIACVTGGIVSVRDQSFGGGAVIQKKGVGRSGLRLSWWPRRQISLSNYAISPAMQAIVLMLSHYVFLFFFFQQT